MLRISRPVNLSNCRKIATAKEAREIMRIGVWYNSVDETLKNLGMPPNRGDDDRGFVVWEHPMAYCMTPPPLTAGAEDKELVGV